MTEETNAESLRPHEIIFKRMSEYVGMAKDNDVPMACVFALEKTDDPDVNKRWKMTYSCHPQFVQTAAMLAEQMNLVVEQEYADAPDDPANEQPVMDEMLLEPEQ